jgi:soluble lytic murein transglycosylase-like protein
MLPSLIGPTPTPEEPPRTRAGMRLRSLLDASGRTGFLRKAAQRTVMGAGVCAIGAIGVMFVKPELTDHIKAMSPFAAESTQQAAAAPAPAPAPTLVVRAAGTPTAAAMPAEPAAASVQAAEASQTSAANPANHIEHVARIQVTESKEPAPREQKWVTNWLSKRYRVAGDATNMLVSATYHTAKEVKIDPLLVLAVMAIESGFNPFAESPMGAQGLMQVMSKVHHDKFQSLGGVKAALNPVANIKVGATILKEYVHRGGSLESGLKMYVGAAAFDTDAGYGYKVLAEYKRLKDVASGKNVPVTNTTASPATVVVKTPPKPAVPVVDDKDDVLTQADRTDLRSKEADQDGVVAAL